MSEAFPYTTYFAGKDLTVYPHKVRSQQKRDHWGHRPITVGGIVVGYFAKDEVLGSFEGFDIDHKPLNIVCGRASEVGILVATNGRAHQAYIDEALDGTFGKAAQQWVRAAQEATVDADDAEDDVVVRWPYSCNANAVRATVTLDGAEIGSVVQVFESSPIAPGGRVVKYYAQTPDSAQHGVSIGSFDGAVITLVAHVKDQREIEAALATVEAPTPLESSLRLARREENVQQAWVAVLNAIDAQEGIDPDTATSSLLSTVREMLRSVGVLEDIKLED